MMVTVLLVCFVAGVDWKPPDGWVIQSISNRATSAEVRLTRQARDGEAIHVPQGCGSEPPPAMRLDYNGTLPYNGIGNLQLNHGFIENGTNETH